MSVLGNLIVILVTAGVTYFAVSSMGVGGPAGPVTLNPDIQRYIDTKLTGTTGTTTQELQKLTSRLEEMESKLLEAERVRAQYDQLAGKSELIESAIADQRRRREEVVAQARLAEAAKLRNDIATVCAGVTVKRVESSPNRGSNPEADRFRQNIGDTVRPAAPQNGARPQQQPWMQNRNRRGGQQPGGPGGQRAAPVPPGGAAGDQNR